MKDKPPFPFEDPFRERFVDAALREHVRIGSAVKDSDLVDSILKRTVEQKRPAAYSASAKAEYRKHWIAGAASAAAILAVLATLLAVLPFQSSSRDVDEIRFIVQYGETSESQSEAAFSAPPRKREPTPFSGTIDISVSHQPLESSAPGVSEYQPLDLAFSPSFSEVPKLGFREERIQIVADQTTQIDGRIVYEGNVEVIHDNFRLTSDHVEITGHDDEWSTGVVRLVSRNALLKQSSPDRTALAEQLDYEPATNRFTLLGVAFLNSAEGQLTDFSPEDRVFLIGETLIVQKEAQAR
ncbi:MAG: LptA/OstA family protein [Verrucomicrobiales bacterium]|nr:LptA/OstA family protein [Verrucomicrobiales bacterium]